MIRLLATSTVAIAVALLGASCSNTARAGRRSVGRGPVVLDQQRGYFALDDGSVHLASEGAPGGLHVVGTVEGGRFIPEGDVQGEGDVGLTGAPGWLELLDGSFHPAQSSRPPLTPYIEGAMTPEGIFSPSSRAVVY